MFNNIKTTLYGKLNNKKHDFKIQGQILAWSCSIWLDPSPSMVFSLSLDYFLFAHDIRFRQDLSILYAHSTIVSLYHTSRGTFSDNVTRLSCCARL